MTRMFVNTKIRIQKAIEARDAGQGTLEYLGIVVIAAILVVALITAFDGFNLQEKISTQLSKISDAIPG